MQEKPDTHVLLIDGENLPNLYLKDLPASEMSVTHNLHIVVFVGEHHPQSQKTLPEFVQPHITIQRIVVSTTHTDGVDAAMQAYVGYMLSQHDAPTSLMIATLDRFGPALVDAVLNKNGALPWTSLTKCCLVSRIDHVLDALLKNNEK